MICGIISLLVIFVFHQLNYTAKKTTFLSFLDKFVAFFYLSCFFTAPLLVVLLYCCENSNIKKLIGVLLFIYFLFCCITNFRTVNRSVNILNVYFTVVRNGFPSNLFKESYIHRPYTDNFKGRPSKAVEKLF